MNRCQDGEERLGHFPARRLYILSWSLAEGGCVNIGHDAATAEQTLARISTEKLLADMAQLPNIAYLMVEERGLDPDNQGVQLLNQEQRIIARIGQPLDAGRMLVVGLYADNYGQRISQLKSEFVLFSGLLLALGAFFSWLLNRYQNRHLKQVRHFERQMARQHEEAALGRAAATISHELKNPLNAIGMGLQRIQMEVKLEDEHNRLLQAMRQALGRSSAIISDLKRQTEQVVPVPREIRPRELIEAVLALYRPRCQAGGIELSYQDDCRELLWVDEGLLARVFENMLKNAIEAQPTGGRIKIQTDCREGFFQLSTENPGFTGPPTAAATIFEPYFTSKARGSGLGLAISRRIAEAHGGELHCELPAAGIIRIILTIPLRREVNSDKGP